MLALLSGLAFLSPAKAQDNELAKAVGNITGNYLALKDALAGNDANAAADKAKALLASVEAMPRKSMNAKQLALWSKYAEKLQYDSRHISEVNMLAHQREHFASLSDNLYQVLKGLKLNRAVIYRNICTMREKHFLSAAPGGRDPYMGMDHCSKVTEILPANR